MNRTTRHEFDLDEEHLRVIQDRGALRLQVEFPDGWCGLDAERPALAEVLRLRGLLEAAYDYMNQEVFAADDADELRARIRQALGREEGGS